MSAVGTKRTSTTEFRCPLLGVKRTSRGRKAMSANDPKRNGRIKVQLLPNRRQLNEEVVGGEFLKFNG
jgi:hypothetical protein